MKDYFYRKLSVCLLVMFLVITGSFILKEDVFAETGGKVYVTVEKFTIGQGYLIEPCVVTLQEGDNAAIILDRV